MGGHIESPGASVDNEVHGFLHLTAHEDNSRNNNPRKNGWMLIALNYVKYCQAVSTQGEEKGTKGVSLHSEQPSMRKHIIHRKQSKNRIAGISLD